MRIAATASHFRQSSITSDAFEVDVSLTVGTETQAILLMVGQVTVSMSGDGYDIHGAGELPISAWLCPDLIEDIGCLPPGYLAKVLVELRRAALDACTGSRRGAA